jgi:hypothetical protein
LSYLRCPGHKRTVHPLMLQGLQRGAPPARKQEANSMLRAVFWIPWTAPGLSASSQATRGRATSAKCKLSTDHGVVCEIACCSRTDLRLAVCLPPHSASPPP